MFYGWISTCFNYLHIRWWKLTETKSTIRIKRYSDQVLELKGGVSIVI